MFGQKHLKEEFTVNSPIEQPTDTISSISWSKTSFLPTFATRSWDSHIRIYQVDPEGSSLRQTANLDAKSPCLGVVWHGDSIQVFAGCASGDVKGFDSTNSKGFNVGSHTKPVKDVHWVAEMKTLCSVSFDKTVKLWDLRQAGPVYQCELRYKPFSSDVHESKLALALSEYQVAVVDLAEALKTQSAHEGLKYLDRSFFTQEPLSCVKFLPNGEMLAFGTAGGKVNISELRRDPGNMGWLNNLGTFLAYEVDYNRSMTPKVKYPVNSILVNSKKPRSFIGTCGGEGKICCWDFDYGDVCAELRANNPVTCGKMSWDGDWLAFATGYDWSRGISEYMSKPSEVYIRRVRDEQLVYKEE